MAHIPPGVDVYGTYHRYLFAPGQACSVKQPQMFLSNEALGDTIAEFSDIIRLAIFAHTHMDEIKLIQGADGAVPVKLVPSISPINGNEPTFVIAQISPDSATLKDYEAYSASSAQGTGWGREYRYSAVYGLAGLLRGVGQAAYLATYQRQEWRGRDQPRLRTLLPRRAAAHLRRWDYSVCGRSTVARCASATRRPSISACVRRMRSQPPLHSRP